MKKIFLILFAISTYNSFGKKTISYHLSPSLLLQKYNNFYFNLEPLNYYNKFIAEPQFAYSLKAGVSWENLLTTYFSLQHSLPTKISSFSPDKTTKSSESKLSSLVISLDSKVTTASTPLSLFVGAGAGVSFNMLGDISRNYNDNTLGSIPSNTTTGLAWKVFTGVSWKTSSLLTMSLQFNFINHGALESSQTYNDTLLDEKTALTHYYSKKNLSSFSAAYDLEVKL
jgi:hypothetical protein